MKENNQKGSERELFKKLWRLNNAVRWDMSNTENLSDMCAKSEGKDIKGRFTIQALSLDCIDMREDNVDSILREIVKGLALRDNVAKEGMVFLDLRFLRGLHRVTEKQR